MWMKSRPRRLRQNAYIRELVKENELEVSDLIAPLFFVEGSKQKNCNRFNARPIQKKSRSLSRACSISLF
jgi:delta-aminolevulinic acid dehydratase/porphobilinogen synthase